MTFPLRNDSARSVTESTTSTASDRAAGSPCPQSASEPRVFETRDLLDRAATIVRAHAGPTRGDVECRCVTLVDGSPNGVASAVLARAEEGARLSVDDAEALLRAEATTPRGCCRSQERCGMPGSRHPVALASSPTPARCSSRLRPCAATGCPTASSWTRRASCSPARAHVHDTRTGAVGVARPGSGPGLQRGALRARRPARGPLARGPGVARRARLCVDARLCRCDGAPHTAETGMLPHLNPGGHVVRRAAAALRPTAPSMGMMLETTSRRLSSSRGRCTSARPTRTPALRLAVIDDAGRAKIPFTTGILVGIGETLRDRAEWLVALPPPRAVRPCAGGDRAGLPGEAGPQCAAPPTRALLEYAAALAVARLVLGPRCASRFRRNLPGSGRVLVAGARAADDDWGGVSPLTADHVNPERPRPHLDDLTRPHRGELAGFELRERSPPPGYVRRTGGGSTRPSRRATLALADPSTGSLGWGPESLHSRVSRARPGRPGRPGLVPRARRAPRRLAPRSGVGVVCSSPRGTDLDAARRDRRRRQRYTVGEAVSPVINRNIASSSFRAAPRGEPDSVWPRRPRRDRRRCVGAGRDRALRAGCSRHPRTLRLLAIARVIKAAVRACSLRCLPAGGCHRPGRSRGPRARRRARCPAGSGRRHRPADGVKMLSERVRGLVAPGDLEIDRWIETITAEQRCAASARHPCCSTACRNDAAKGAHLRSLLAIQAVPEARRAAGSAGVRTIPLPGHGVPLVEGRSRLNEHRAMFAVARLMLSSAIPHIQVPWTRVRRADAPYCWAPAPTTWAARCWTAACFRGSAPSTGSSCPCRTRRASRGDYSGPSGSARPTRTLRQVQGPGAAAPPPWAQEPTQPTRLP